MREVGQHGRLDAAALGQLIDQLGQALQGAKLDARHHGVIAMSQACGHILVALTAHEQAFNHGHALEGLCCKGFLTPSTRCRPQQAARILFQFVTPHDAARRLGRGSHEVEARGTLLHPEP